MYNDDSSVAPQQRYAGDCDDCSIYLVRDTVTNIINDVTSDVTWAGAVNLTVAFAATATAGLLL